MATTAMIGRRAALDAAGEALDRALAGRGCVLVVEGEPGIGKSSLAAAVAERAEAAGAVCRWGRAWELGNAPPYFPLRACLRELGVDTDAGDEAPFALWERVLDALARAAATRPQVWIIEDAHAADLLTLDLLAFLAQPVRGLAALIVVTRRDRDPRLTPAAEQRLVRMVRGGAGITLAPLAAEDAAALAVQAAGHALDAGLLRRLWELAGGNPLFVVECARTLARGDGRGAALPATLRQLVEERLDALPATTREVVEAAALLGREVTAAALAALFARLPARVIDDLAPALRAGLVIERRPGEFAFSHVIVRDAIEDATPASTRAGVHVRAAEMLAGNESPEAVVERARHTLSAIELGTGGEVAPRFRQDGVERLLTVDSVTAAIALCSDRGAWDRAFALAERLDLARRAGHLPAGTFDERLQVASLATAAGRASESRRRCLELVADAAARGDAVEQARATLTMGSELRPGVVDIVLVAHLRDAIAAIGERDAALLCRLQARLAAAEQPAPDPHVPAARAEEAIAAARRLGDPAVLCEVLDIGGAALVDYATMERRLEVAGELLAVARAGGDRPREIRALCRRAMDRAEHGEHDGFVADVDEALRRSLALGQARFRWRPLLMSSMQAIAEGRVMDSERAVVEVQQMAAMIDDPALRLSLAAHAIERARLLHLDDQLREAASQVERMMDGVPGAQYVAAVLRMAFYARLEDPEATATELARIGTVRQEFEHDSTFHPHIGEAEALIGDEASVRRVRDQLVRWPQPEMVGGHIPIVYNGPRARIVARLDHRLGDRAAAERGLREALASVEARGLRTWVAQISYELGLLGAGFESYLERAATLAQEIGMPGLVVRARAAMSNAATATATPAPTKARRVTIARDGETWIVTGGATPVRIRDSRGVRMLARLVERPDEEIHVLALAADDPSTALVESAGAPVVDAEARRAYKERIEALDERLERAEALGDERAYERATREREALVKELTRTAGLGGAARKTGGAAERARTNVQRRVKDAIDRIGEQDATLGAYLERAVRTGSYCCFRP